MEQAFNTYGIMFIVLGWGAILSLVVYCFTKILRKKSD